MAQIQIKSLLGKANSVLEKGTHFFGSVLIKRSEMEAIIDAVAAAVPEDIREAEAIVTNKEEIIREAQSRAERIIQEAITEQQRLVNDNEIMKKVQEAAMQQKQQVDEYCENIQATAAKNAEILRNNSLRESTVMLDGAEDYAQKIFADLDTDVDKISANIKQCRTILAEQITRNRQTRQRVDAPAQQQNEQAI